MSEQEQLTKTIHDANLAVHKIEVAYYTIFHPEVYNRNEQRRLIIALNQADKLTVQNRKKALDFGAGTGNVTSKLLAMGYTVTAVDISPEMCEALRKSFRSQIDKGKLVVVNSPIENVEFDNDVFDFVSCYSVLHHLPNYEGVLLRLCSLLRKGGVMFLDHEASPYYWKNEPTMLGKIVKSIYLHSNPLINSLYFRIIGFKVPNMDYELSDYWHKKEHNLDHDKIQSIFKQQEFEFSRRTDYYSIGTWVPNPIFAIYKHVCRPDMSLWIAKK
ncbi:MAG TPA: class I SAM-dependent methyltransferase [Candidatus Nanoarchaeia archaeon]|nr:class I SAM-dependent methyltransferase [Candidatus Nanoarchaeia archaeon]